VARGCRSDKHPELMDVRLLRATWLLKYAGWTEDNGWWKRPSEKSRPTKGLPRRRELEKPSGLQWRRVGRQKPRNGEELTNERLVARLHHTAGTTTFTQKE
jgi:hypothetical protein